MPISQAACEQHIAKWETTLAKSAYPYRKHWPGRLFRHEPLESAVRIIKSGDLRSRNHAAGIIANDVAPEGIIGANDIAHSDARLYFRPRNPTQWNIEGIREPVDYFKGKHAAVLYMLLFDARRVLTSPGVRFSDGNMQSHQSLVYSDDFGFSQLRFEDIYHEGVIQDRRDTIRRSRCAEVLCSSPLTLGGNLEAIICRSDAERRLLLHELGNKFVNPSRVLVFKEPGLFNADYSFVESADLASDGLSVRLHPPRRGASLGRIQMSIIAENGQMISHADQSLDLSKSWKFGAVISDGRYLVEIRLRNHLAYRSALVLDSSPF